MKTITIQISEAEANAITDLLRARDTGKWYKYNSEDYALTDAVLARILRAYIVTPDSSPAPAPSVPSCKKPSRARRGRAVRRVPTPNTPVL